MKKVFVVILALVTVAATQAQRKRVPEKLMAEKMKLSEDQKQKAKELNESYRKNMMDLRKKDDITVKEWRNRMEELNKKHREDMQGLLNKSQKDQIEKMKLQRQKIADINADARLDKMKLRLDLNDDQVNRLRKQRMEMMGDMKRLRENRSMDMMRKRDAVRDMMKERQKSIKSILTEEQMKKMQEQKKNLQRKRRVLS